MKLKALTFLLLLWIGFFDLSAQSNSSKSPWSLQLNLSKTPNSQDPSIPFMGLGLECQFWQAARWSMASQVNVMAKKAKGQDGYSSRNFIESAIKADLRLYYSVVEGDYFRVFVGGGTFAAMLGAKQCLGVSGDRSCSDYATGRLMPFAMLGLRLYPFGERLYLEYDIQSSLQMDLRLGWTFAANH